MTCGLAKGARAEVRSVLGFLVWSFPGGGLRLADAVSLRQGAALLQSASMPSKKNEGGTSSVEENRHKAAALMRHSPRSYFWII